MSTLLSTENRDQLIARAEQIFAHSDFDGSRQLISALAHANYSDCIEGLTEEQRQILTEYVDHIDYSLRMHQKILADTLARINVPEQRKQKCATAQEALALEVMAIFRDWPVF